MTTNDRREHLKAQLAEKLRAVEEHAELRAENERLKAERDDAQRLFREAETERRRSHAELATLREHVRVLRSAASRIWVQIANAPDHEYVKLTEAHAEVGDALAATAVRDSEVKK